MSFVHQFGREKCRFLSLAARLKSGSTKAIWPNRIGKKLKAQDCNTATGVSLNGITFYIAKLHLGIICLKNGRMER